MYIEVQDIIDAGLVEQGDFDDELIQSKIALAQNSVEVLTGRVFESRLFSIFKRGGLLQYNFNNPIITVNSIVVSDLTTILNSDYIIIDNRFPVSSVDCFAVKFKSDISKLSDEILFEGTTGYLDSEDETPAPIKYLTARLAHHYLDPDDSGLHIGRGVTMERADDHQIMYDLVSSRDDILGDVELDNIIRQYSRMSNRSLDVELV